MMRLACLLTAFALAVASVGCHSAPKQSQTDKPTGLPVEPGPARDLGMVPQWAAKLDLPETQHVGTVSVLEELGLVVTIERPVNVVTAMSLRTGRKVWTQVIGGTDENLYHAHIYNDKQFIVNSEKRLFVLSAVDGRIEGLSVLGSTVISDPVLVNDYAVFGGRNGQVFAHDVQAGFSKWAYQMKAAILTGPVRSGQSVFVADTGGDYALITVAEGQMQWRERTWGAVTAQPAISLAAVYVACRDSSLYAINRTTGADIWVYRVTEPLTDAPMPIGRLVLQPVPGDGLHAVDALRGELLWKRDSIITPIQPIGQNFLAHTDRQLLIVSAEDGRALVVAPTKRLRTVVAGPDESIIVVTPEGELLRLNPKK